MPRKDSMEFIHDDDGDGKDPFAGFAADEDDDTPYDAFKKTTASDEDDEDDLEGGVEVDLNPPKAKKSKDADEDDEDDIEVVKEVAGSAKKDEDVDEDEDEISAEEMETYSSKVQSRIRKQTRLQRAAERRADRKAAEADEAIRLVQLLQAQNAQMKQLIANGETQYVAASKAASTAAVAAAQHKLRQALADGDAEKIVDAQTELAAATNVAAQASQYRAVAPDIERDAGVIDARVKDFAKRQTEQEFEPDPAAQRWISRNEWFNKDQRMRSFAIEFAKDLEADGYHPIKDAKDYYREIDKEMRKRFPEKFSDDQDERPQRRAAQQPSNKRPVAAARSSGPVVKNGKLKVTESMVRTAQRLGIPVAEYAREYAKMYPKG